MTRTQYTTVWWGVRFTRQSRQRNREEGWCLDGNRGTEAATLVPDTEPASGRGHRAAREGRALPAAAAAGPRRGLARHTVREPQVPACPGAGALEESGSLSWRAHNRGRQQRKRLRTTQAGAW